MFVPDTPTLYIGAGIYCDTPIIASGVAWHLLGVNLIMFRLDFAEIIHSQNVR